MENVTEEDQKKEDQKKIEFLIDGLDILAFVLSASSSLFSFRFFFYFFSFTFFLLLSCYGKEFSLFDKRFILRCFTSHFLIW